MARSGPGLRATKKARTREAISDAATALFRDHGFEHVTVADIAEAADVSIKTVFNYFSTKEDLFFDRADELIDGLVRTIEQRPAGMSVTQAIHRLLRDNMVPFAGAGWRGLRDPDGYERYRGFVATEHAAAALRARRLVIAEAWTGRLAAVVASELGLREGDQRAEVLAAMLVGAMGARERTLAAAVLDRRSPAAVQRRVRAVVDEAFDRIGRAFGDIDTGRRSG